MAPKGFVRRLLSTAAVLMWACDGMAADTGPAMASQLPAVREVVCLIGATTDVSGPGGRSLSDLVDWATSNSIDAIFLADDLSQELQLGIPPWRHATRFTLERHSSILIRGSSQYREMVARENVRQTNVLVVPGFRVSPRYYWTGSLAGGDLVCHDFDRKLAVLSPSDSAVWEDVSFAGGASRRHGEGMRMALLLVAAIGVVLGCALLLFACFLAEPASRRRWCGGGAAVAILGILFAMAVDWSAAQRESSRIYGEPDRSQAVAQDIVGRLARSGETTYWSEPGRTVYREGAVMGMPYAVATVPDNGLLRATEGTLGFSGLSEESLSMVRAGGPWDGFIQDHIQGRRQSAVWCLGEYDGGTASVETVATVADRTPSAILSALRGGAFYSRRRSGDQVLLLESWSLQRNPESVLLKLTVSSVRPGERVNLQLIRNGRVMKQVDGVTPTSLVFHDILPSAGQASYYRAIVVGAEPLRLVTNPLFVQSPGVEP